MAQGRFLGKVRRAGRAFWTSPQLRFVRWVLIVGAAVRLILLPISSWGVDTPSFILANIGFLATGSPYSSYLYFNPPLGIYVQSPFFVLLSLFQSPEAMVHVVPSLLAASVQSAMISSLVPSGPALVALKLPLLISDILTLGLLFRLVGRHYGARVANVAAALWFLNPVVIWASAVHGEVDTLAALFLVAWLYASLEGKPLYAGLALALAVFAKLYPAFMLPMAVAWWLPLGWERVRRWSGWSAIGRFAAGFGLGVLPFAPFLVPIAKILSTASGAPSYGGLSILVLYNSAARPFVYTHGPLGPSLWFAVLRGLGVLAILATVAYLLSRGRPRWREELSRPANLALMALWCGIAGLLSYSSPQSENVVGLVALGAVAWPVLGRTGRTSLLLLSGAAFALYMALLTPWAFFYPLADRLGPSALDHLNQVALAYVGSTGPLTQGLMWEITGVVGGAATLALWAVPALRLVRQVIPGGAVKED